jgi:hypothetical protein
VEVLPPEEVLPAPAESTDVDEAAVKNEEDDANDVFEAADVPEVPQVVVPAEEKPCTESADAQPSDSAPAPTVTASSSPDPQTLGRFHCVGVTPEDRSQLTVSSINTILEDVIEMEDETDDNAAAAAAANFVYSTLPRPPEHMTTLRAFNLLDFRRRMLGSKTSVARLSTEFCVYDVCLTVAIDFRPSVGSASGKSRHSSAGDEIPSLASSLPKASALKGSNKALGAQNRDRSPCVSFDENPVIVTPTLNGKK